MNATTRERGPAHRGLIGAGSCSVVFCMLAWRPAWADVPDNRDVRLARRPVSLPDDGTLQERDEQRLKEALEEGGWFVKTVHGLRGVPWRRDLPEGYRHD